MSEISRINSSRISEIRTSITPNQINQETYRFQEKFDFSEMELKKNSPGTLEEQELFLQILFKLFKDILIDGADIVPRGVLTNKKIVIEASFMPPKTIKDKPQLFLPIYGVKKIDGLKFHLTGFYKNIEIELTNYCNQIKKYTTHTDLAKLIILAGHEYGHFLSYQRGFHDQKLKTGLYFVHTKQIGKNFEEYTYQVFSEEATAWRFAKERLEKYSFNEWGMFNSVKNASLKEYYKLLGFNKDVTVSTLCKISMLDVDSKSLSSPQ